MKSNGLINTALKRLEENRKNYGDAQTMLNEIAAGWSLISNNNYTATDVCNYLTVLKLIRLKTDKDDKDSIVDIIGYNALLDFKF